MLKERWEKLVRVDAASGKGQVVFLVMIMGIATLIALVEAFIMLSWAPLLAALFGWAVVVMYALLSGTAFKQAGGAIASITVPSGGSTPSVAQHSNIEALEAKGRYDEAVQAYKDVIASQPADLVACEKLGQLALHRLKDYETALFAYREAEKRVTEPKRKLGFAMMVAGIYRDNLKDYGRAMVELRRIVAKYPDAPNRARLSAEVDELKALHFEGQ